MIFACYKSCNQSSNVNEHLQSSQIFFSSCVSTVTGVVNSLPTVQFGCSVLSDSLRPHGLQHARPPCPSPIPGACSNSCPSSQWPAIQPSHPLISPSPPAFIFPSIRVFSNESVLHRWWPKYWSFSFSISPSNEHSGLSSFRMDWLDLLEVQRTQESSLTLQFKSINSSVLNFLYSPTLTSIHDYWKNHSFD